MSRSPSFLLAHLTPAGSLNTWQEEGLRDPSSCQGWPLVRLSSANHIVEVGFEGEDDHPFTAVRFDVGKQARDFDSGDGGNLAAGAFPSRKHKLAMV